MADGFFNIRLKKNSEPEITTLVLKHGKSIFDFSFAEESDGTKRLLDLIDMLLTKRQDLLYVVDELESWEPASKTYGTFPRAVYEST
jgi:AAA15 family ATPase/GTPase